MQSPDFSQLKDVPTIDGNEVGRRFLPGVPAIESPFLSHYFPPTTSDPELMRIATEMHTQGYSALSFPDSNLDQLSQKIINDLTPQFDFHSWRNKPDAKRAGLRIQDAYKTNSAVKALACNPQILDLLAKLYGRKPIPFQTLNFPVGSQQHFHTDSVHFSSLPAGFMCGVWIALEDIGPEQGPLMYYPGTHRWPTYCNDEIGAYPNSKDGQSRYEALWQALVNEAGIEPKAFYAKKGDALIWAANLLHGGMPHFNEELTRWSQVTHYYFEGCTYYTPLFSSPAHGLWHYRTPTNILNGELVRNSLETHPKDFDPERYLELNPDVKAADSDPYEHFLRFGAIENRPW
jgi:hypothetical protein